MTARLASLVLALAAASAGAQTIYSPVTVQYGGQQPYYYAGSDPLVHAAAAFPSAPGAAWGRVGGYAFVSPRRAVVQRNIRTYTDAFGTLDARPWGLTPDEVTNEAYARLPRYVRKLDLLAAAEPDGEGSRVIAAHAPARVPPRGTMTIRPSVPYMYRSGGATIVVPKRILDRKVADAARAPRA